MVVSESQIVIALFSGFISLVVSYLVSRKTVDYKMERKSELNKQEDLKTWYNDLLSLLNKLKSDISDLSAEDGDIAVRNAINIRISDLEERNHESPPEASQEVYDSIRAFTRETRELIDDLPDECSEEKITDLVRSFSGKESRIRRKINSSLNDLEN